MELAFVGNAVLFLGALGVQFGLFDGAQSEDEASADTAEADSGTAEAEIVPIDVRGTTDDDGGTETAAPGDSDPDDYDPDDYASEVSGTDGDDTQAYESGPTPVAYFLHDGDDELDASPGEDFADGGAGNDTLRMRLGDDIAVGGDGDDTIDGGLGSDSLWGGVGQDSIAGNKGDDMLLGDAGNDTLTSSLGDDSLYGGTGDDQLYGDVPSLQGEWADGSDMLVGGEGDDSLHVAGGATGPREAKARTISSSTIPSTARRPARSPISTSPRT